MYCQRCNKVSERVIILRNNERDVTIDYNLCIEHFNEFSEYLFRFFEGVICLNCGRKSFDSICSNCCAEIKYKNGIGW